MNLFAENYLDCLDSLALLSPSIEVRDLLLEAFDEEMEEICRSEKDGIYRPREDEDREFHSIL